MTKEIEELARRYPWPETKPDLPFDGQGWFGWCHKAMMDVVLPKDYGVTVIELGSWLGLSTRFILSSATTATVLAIDHWRGDESILKDADEETKNKMPVLYETFLSNCWKYKDRLVPMRTTTIEGLREIKALGIKPSFIFLDASHQYEDVKEDMDEIWRLYPDVRLGGDDYGGKWEGVKKAVDEFASRAGRVVCLAEHAWTIGLPEEKGSITEGLKLAMHFRHEEMDRSAQAKRSSVMASSDEE